MPHLPVIAIKTIVFSFLVPGTVTIAIPYLLLTYGYEIYRFHLGILRYSGVVPIVAGLMFYIVSAADFVRQGKGTPAPIDPPKRLVRKRIFRFTRNPMYLGGVLILIGESLFFCSTTLLIYALIMWTVFHLFVVLYEEPHLRRLFGAEYEQYLKEVPRWFSVSRKKQ